MENVLNVENCYLEIIRKYVLYNPISFEGGNQGENEPAFWLQEENQDIEAELTLE